MTSLLTKKKQILITSTDLKINGQLPYLLARRLQAQFIGNQASFWGGLLTFSMLEQNYTLVPYLRKDKIPHTKKAIEELLAWLYDDAGFEWVCRVDLGDVVQVTNTWRAADERLKEIITTMLSQTAENTEQQDIVPVVETFIAYPNDEQDVPIATLICSDTAIQTRLLERDNDFSDVVKGLGYGWDGMYWQRTITTEYTGNIVDRAVELGQQLLEAGFAVKFPTLEIHDLALSGDYKPECHTWVFAGSGQYDGWFRLRWNRHKRNFYSLAKEITDSRYDRETWSVVVPSTQYQELEDFATKHGFRFSPEALEILKAARQQRDQALVADDTTTDKSNTSLLVYPANPVTASIGTIQVTETCIKAWMPSRDDDFRKIAKNFGFHWSISRWQRELNPEYAGAITDRAAELGRHLLGAGFPIQFPSLEVRDLALSGDYEPECRRWVFVGSDQYEGWFKLWWGRGDDEHNYYAEAKQITGSQYDRQGSKCVVVPATQFAELEGFTSLYEFHFSQKAAELLREARQQRDAALVTDIIIDNLEGKQVWSRPTLAAPEKVTVPIKLLDYQYSPDFEVKTTLFPYQQRGVDKFQPLNVAGLFMDVGTGKTRVAIELAYLRRQRISSVVWFCPVTLKQTIAYELRKHTTLPESAVYIFDDKTKMRNLPRAWWYIIGTESMSSSDRIRLAVNSLVDQHSMVLVDESSDIKGHDSNRTRWITQIGERARYRAILTGTPISQGVVDLYAQMRFLSSDILGYPSFFSFAANHLTLDPERPGLVVASHNVEYLTRQMEPYIYQVTRDECLDLPPTLYDSRYYAMTYDQRELYDQAKWELLLSLPEDEIDGTTIFRLFTALQQIVSGFWNRNGKLVEIEHHRLNFLMDWINDLPEQKIIIWCKYIYSVKQIAQRLRQEYGNDAVTMLYGELDEKERNQELDKFRNEARFLVATQGTGGKGLTLTESRTAIFYENEFKYLNRMQAEGRIDRIGKTDTTLQLDLACMQSIDERIQRAHVRKENVVQSFRRRVRNLQNKQLRKVIEKL